MLPVQQILFCGVEITINKHKYFTFQFGAEFTWDESTLGQSCLGAELTAAKLVWCRVDWKPCGQSVRAV